MTTRTLVLLRHAKADSPVGLADDQRPLTARGRVDAHAAGVWLARHSPPGLVLCSPSRRTRQTWQQVVASLAATGGGDVADQAVRFDPRLYGGRVTDILAVVREVDDTVAVVLVIGHNPGLSLLSHALDPDATADSGALRTCGLAVHQALGSWRDCAPGAARLIASHTARGDR